jgi:hypothetical protein
MIQLRSLRTGAMRLVCTSMLAWLTLGGVATGQQVQGAPTQEVATFFVRGVDSAFDPAANAYLVVGGQGVLVGVCINASGFPIAGPFTINGDGYGSFPRVRYSPHVFGTGGFLVAWGEEVGNPSEIHGRTVSCSGAMGAEQVLSGGHSAWLESGPALAYSTTSQRFLVAWKSFPPNVRVKVTLVDNGGTRVSEVVDVSPEFGRDPGATWNPHTNQFGVSFSGENSSGTAVYSGFAVVPAWNPAGFARTTFNFLSGAMTTITDLDVNTATGNYVMTWFELSSGALAKIAEFDPNGNIATQGVASGRLGSYDALSIAYNPISGTFLLGGIDRGNDAMLGLELNARGFPFNGENTLSATHRPSYYTRVASSTLSRNWSGTFAARGFNGIGSVIVTSFASGGGPPGSFAGGGGGTSEPPPPPPPSTGCSTVQPGPGWTCVNGNWFPGSDTGGGGSGDGSCTTVSPGAGWVCDNGNWQPPTTTPSSGGCTTVSPGSGWVCVNGGWLPSGSPGAPLPPSSSCPSVQPGPGWVCVNGGWVPLDSPLAPSYCPTVSPGPGWVCVNGGWLPPDQAPATGGGGGGGCTTPIPVTGWFCVNGGWVPPDSPYAPTGCSTPWPGTGWVCVNGGWLPPDQAPASAVPPPGSSCVGAAPAAGWVCVSGSWLPPNHPLVTGG